MPIPARSAIGVLMLLAGAAAVPIKGSDASLARLTVPATLLPKDCQLTPVVKDANGKTRFVMYPGVKVNPWIGTRSPTIGLIRDVVEGAARDHRGELRRAEGHVRSEHDVAEGYIARYNVANAANVDVYAVRFHDPRLTMKAGVQRLTGDDSLILSGAIAIHIKRPRPPTWLRGSDSIDRCYRAIRSYVESLK